MCRYTARAIREALRQTHTLHTPFPGCRQRAQRVKSTPKWQGGFKLSRVSICASLGHPLQQHQASSCVRHAPHDNTPPTDDCTYITCPHACGMSNCVIHTSANTNSPVLLHKVLPTLCVAAAHCLWLLLLLLLCRGWGQCGDSAATAACGMCPGAHSAQGCWQDIACSI